MLTGGRASLKSTTVHDFVVRLTLESGHGILFTRYTMASAEKSIIPEFNATLKRNNSYNLFHKVGNKYVNRVTGSFILFSGIKTSSGDQTANLKSIAGITTWIIDEGEDFNNESTFDDIDDSIRSIIRQNRVIWIQNSSTREHFIYKRWIETTPQQIEVEGQKVIISGHPEVEAIHTTYHIAAKQGYLSKSFLRKVERLKKTNPKKYYHKYIGGWLDKAEGVVYENWEIGEFNESLPYCYGLDVGVEDPDALTKVALDHSQKIIYIEEMFFSNGLGTPQLCEIVMNIVGRTDLVVCDSAAKRTIQDLYDFGVNAIKCGKKDVQYRIKTIQGYKLVVTKNSVNLQKALNNYRFHDKRSGIPHHDWSDLCDSFGYAAIDLITY